MEVTSSRHASLQKGSLKRHALLYAVLVGVPVLGLIGILHFGQRLAAPESIGGLWRVDIDGEPVGPLAKLLSDDNAGFRISQSGDRFELKPRGSLQTPGAGTLEGRELHAERRRRSGDVDWTIHATLGPEPETLHGTWSFVASTTVALGFKAVRVEPTRGKGE